MFFLPWRLEGAKLGCRYSVPSLQGPRTWLFAAIFFFFGDGKCCEQVMIGNWDELKGNQDRDEL